MGKDLTNDFSWSKSRHEKFSECRRAYYLHYYASWGGWEAQAPAWKRELYILKKLGNRWKWSGGIVHDTIRNALLDVRAGRDVNGAQAIERAYQQMRDDYAHSMHRSYWKERNRRDFSGLVEHEYGELIRSTEWKRNWESARQALEWWFFKSPWLGIAGALKAEQWLEVDNRSLDESVFNLRGIRVFAVPDFAYVDGEGVPVIVDWKTGRAREGYDEQVLAYALYLAARHGVRSDQVRASLIYLNDGLESCVQVDSETLKAFHVHFERSVIKMGSVLADPKCNTPKSESCFPMTDNLASCARCVFRRVCRREGAAIQAA